MCLVLNVLSGGLEAAEISPSTCHIGKRLQEPAAAKIFSFVVIVIDEKHLFLEEIINNFCNILSFTVSPISSLCVFLATQIMGHDKRQTGPYSQNYDLFSLANCQHILIPRITQPEWEARLSSSWSCVWSSGWWVEGDFLLGFWGIGQYEGGVEYLRTI